MPFRVETQTDLFVIEHMKYTLNISYEYVFSLLFIVALIISDDQI